MRGGRAFDDLFKDLDGAFGYAFEILCIVGVRFGEDVGSGYQLTIQSEAGEDVARVVGETVKVVGLSAGFYLEFGSGLESKKSARSCFGFNSGGTSHPGPARANSTSRRMYSARSAFASPPCSSSQSA